MNIAIWGMGVSGVSALKSLAKSSHTIYCINSGVPKTWKNFELICEYTQSENCLEESSELLEYKFEQIILSPGIDRKSKLVAHFISQGVEVISEVELAFRQVKLPIVAITGTNGKTTTTTMISECLKRAEKKVFTGGNIGTPFCDILLTSEKYDIAVLELSSFQLESLKSFKANVAIILNIAESHMERYNAFEDYKNAKLNIFNNQEDNDLAIAPLDLLPSRGTPIAKLEGIDLSDKMLIGEHHLYNLFCVNEVLKYFSIPNSLSVIESFLENFGGVEFRLQYVGTKSGMTFYNDAKSTNPYATLSACKAMGENEYALIIGGKLRSEDFDVASLLSTISAKKVLCFGDAADLVEAQMNRNHSVLKFKNLKEVYDYIWESKPARVILFSPGFPSFDQYESYLARGRDFNHLFELGPT